MTALVARLPEIDRAAVRAEAERRFCDAAIAGEYEAPLPSGCRSRPTERRRAA